MRAFCAGDIACVDKATAGFRSGPQVLLSYCVAIGVPLNAGCRYLKSSSRLIPFLSYCSTPSAVKAIDTMDGKLLYCKHLRIYAPVAQLERATDF